MICRTSTVDVRACASSYVITVTAPLLGYRYSTRTVLYLYSSGVDFTRAAVLYRTDPLFIVVLMP